MSSKYLEGKILQTIDSNNKQIIEDMKEHLNELQKYIDLPVYYIKGGYYKSKNLCGVRSGKINEISIKKDKSEKLMLGFITSWGNRYSFKSFGKTIFLTKRDALKAIGKEDE